MSEKFNPHPTFPDGAFSTDVEPESKKNIEFEEQPDEEDPLGLKEDYEEQTNG